MFRLLYFETDNHPVLKGIKINFVGDDDISEENDIYTSVIIGANGTGKSELLSYISSIFRSLHLLKTRKVKKLDIGYRFKMIYKMEEDTYEVSTSILQIAKRRKSNESYDTSFLKNKPQNKEPQTGIEQLRYNQQYSIKIKDLPLPSKVLVSSIMLTDKFNSKSTDSYSYLGVRNEGSPQVAGTKAYIRRTVNFIVESIQQESFITELKKLLSFLELKENLYISYIPRYRKYFMEGNMTEELFHHSFQNWREIFKGRKNEPWGYQYYKSIKHDSALIEKIVMFLNKVHYKLIPYGMGGRYFEYDIINDNDILSDFEMIKHINHLNLLSAPSIFVKKRISSDDYNYSLEQASSGETHFVTSMIGIIASIDKNSIIFMDEPEISLHPNWQMKFIGQLKQSFKTFSCSHFLIATHSHFMVSDLEPQNSNVIALERNTDNRIKAELIEADTYGWSVEEILYKVFKVRSTRNYFFEQDLRELVALMYENPVNINKIKTKLKKIEPFKISSEDPLNKIINQAKELL